MRAPSVILRVSQWWAGLRHGTCLWTAHNLHNTYCTGTPLPSHLGHLITVKFFFFSQRLSLWFPCSTGAHGKTDRFYQPASLCVDNTIKYKFLFFLSFFLGARRAETWSKVELINRKKKAMDGLFVAVGHSEPVPRRKSESHDWQRFESIFDIDHRDRHPPHPQKEQPLMRRAR